MDYQELILQIYTSTVIVNFQKINLSIYLFLFCRPAVLVHKRLKIPEIHISTHNTGEESFMLPIRNLRFFDNSLGFGIAFPNNLADESPTRESARDYL